MTGATGEQSRASPAPSMPKVLALTNLHKACGNTVAVNGVSFHVGRVRKRAYPFSRA